MPEHSANKPVSILPASITQEGSTPLSGTMEWLGNTGIGFIRGKKRSGISPWLLLPVIGLGVFFFLFAMLVLLIFLAIFMLFRVIGSMLFTGKLPRARIITHTFKSS